MLKYLKGIFLYAVILLSASCQENKFDLYENDPKLYFYRGNYNYGEIYQYDSIDYTFRTTLPYDKRDTIWIWAWTMGFPADHPREYALEAVKFEREEEARPGVHYVSFDDPAYKDLLIIPARTEKFRVPVIVLQDHSLDSKKVRLQLCFKENQNFKPGIAAQQNFVLRFSNMLEKPQTWDTWWRYAFGEWSLDKMEFIIKYVGLTDFEQTSSDFGEVSYYKTLAKQKLLEHPDEYPGLTFD